MLLYFVGNKEVGATVNKKGCHNIYGTAPTPRMLKCVLCVFQVIQASSISDKTIFQLVPATLASEIPASRLLVSNLNVSVINQMKWTSSQVTNLQERALSLVR